MNVINNQPTVSEEQRVQTTRIPATNDLYQQTRTTVSAVYRVIALFTYIHLHVSMSGPYRAVPN